MIWSVNKIGFLKTTYLLSLSPFLLLVVCQYTCSALNPKAVWSSQVIHCNIAVIDWINIRHQSQDLAIHCLANTQSSTFSRIEIKSDLSCTQNIIELKYNWWDSEFIIWMETNV